MIVFEKTKEVRFQDVDAAQIVFFPKIFEYFHDTFFDFLKYKGLDVASIIAKSDFIAPIVHAEADYKQTLKFGDSFIVQINKFSIGNSSFSVHYQICCTKKATKLFCTGKTVHCVANKSSGKSLDSIPPQLMNVLKV